MGLRKWFRKRLSIWRKKQERRRDLKAAGKAKPLENPDAIIHLPKGRFCPLKIWMDLYRSNIEIETGTALQSHPKIVDLTKRPPEKPKTIEVTRMPSKETQDYLAGYVEFKLKKH